MLHYRLQLTRFDSFLLHVYHDLLLNVIDNVNVVFGACHQSRKCSSCILQDGTLFQVVHRTLEHIYIELVAFISDDAYLYIFKRCCIYVRPVFKWFMG